jgi:hypothetical protein
MRTLTGETLHRLAFRLNKIWKGWGPKTYPDDNGLHYRNELFLFAEWLTYFMNDACSANPKVANAWIRLNATRFLTLSSEDLMRCVGLARIYQESFWWHLHFYTEPTRLIDEGQVRRKLDAFGTQLDWIHNAHDLPGEVAQSSHKLVVDHLFNGEPYIEASKDLLGKHLVKTKLGWSEASSPERWDHLSCSADLSARRQLNEDSENAKSFCDEVFARFLA